MTLSDKYGRLRTDMEDMIEAHQENARAWKFIKEFYEEQQTCPPTVCLDAIIKQQFDSIKSLSSALKKAKNWIDGDASMDMDDHDHAVYNETVDIINAALKKATQP